MRVISVNQPWCQLVAERRRRTIVKNWEVKPGERFFLHASHVRDEAMTEKLKYSAEDTPKNAILAIIEVEECKDRGLVRRTKFDTREYSLKRNYAIVVKVIEKFRKPIEAKAPVPYPKGGIWEKKIGLL